MIEKNEMFESLEDWASLEDSPVLVNLYIKETKEEMKIKYLVGLEEPVEGVAPGAEDSEEPELDEWKIEANKAKDTYLDFDGAMELAASIKATAVKLFESGNILGDLGAKLDEASASIFFLLRKQKEAALLKEQVKKTKAEKKNAQSFFSDLPTAEIDATIIGDTTTTIAADDLHGATTETADLPGVTEHSV